MDHRLQREILEYAAARNRAFTPAEISAHLRGLEGAASSTDVDADGIGNVLLALQSAGLLEQLIDDRFRITAKGRRSLKAPAASGTSRSLGEVSILRRLLPKGLGLVKGRGLVGPDPEPPPAQQPAAAAPDPEASAPPPAAKVPDPASVTLSVALPAGHEVEPPPPRAKPHPRSAAQPLPAGPASDSQSTDETLAYARIEIDAELRAAAETSLVVGIAPAAQANVVGEPLHIRSPYPFRLRITVAADGFRLRDGESWTTTVTATEQNRFPAITLHLTPNAPSGPEPEERIVAVFYSIEARTLGFGSVTVLVHAADAQPDQASRMATADAVVTTFRDDTETPDLTIRIATYDDGSGRLAWSFESPHFSIPGESPVTQIGKSPELFVAGLIREVDGLGGSDDATQQATMRGIGDQIRDAMPNAFGTAWGALRQAISAPRIPTVLILSDESYIPWELARVDTGPNAAPLAPFDPEAPPLLGAQSEVARWILAANGKLPLPPPLELQLEPMAEVTARYTSPTAPRLEHAEEEGETIRERYRAQHVDARADAILRCLGAADPPATTIHVALHGQWSATSPVQGLIMVDNRVLTPTAVRGVAQPAPQRPFVFLNACQVGAGNEVLAHYAGLPAAFLFARARGVVAPLWSINDVIAKEIALRFYESLQSGTAPAKILRDERKRFMSAPVSTTYLAYIYFGSPASRVTPSTAVPARA